MSLRCDGLTVDLGGRRLLDGLCLDLASGEWTAIVGPNGAGKSTALRAIAGLVGHTGSVEIDGAAATSLSTRERARRLAFVPQNPAIPPATGVRDYLLLGRTPYLGPLAAASVTDHDIVDAVMARLDLAMLAGRSLDTLSGGERQRVILGRALAQQPRVLLLDEPTTALDLGHQVEVLDLVDELRRSEDLTVVSTMHDLSLAGQYADTIALLDGGCLAAAGPPDEVLTADLVGLHYRTAVRVISGDQGPIVVPTRTPRD